MTKVNRDVPTAVAEGDSHTTVVREHVPTAIAQNDRERAKGADPQPIAGAVSEAQIAVRAYELYLNRDSQDGADLDDWLQAERELPSTRGAPTEE